MAAPALASAIVGSSGLVIATGWSESAVGSVQGATFAIAARLLSGAVLTVPGAPGMTINMTTLVQIYQGETVTMTIPAGTVVDAATGLLGNPLVTAYAVTNNSTVVLAAACDGAAAGMMVNRCMVLRKTTTSSTSSGATKQAWAPIYYPVCCAIQMRQSRESMSKGQEKQGFSFNGYFPASLALVHTDRICTITGNNVRGLSGKILEVVGAPSDHAGRGAYLFAPLMEVAGNG